jgi:ribosomal protein S27AE
VGFEELLKEESPEIYQQLMSLQDGPLDVEFKLDFCSRCGATIVTAQQPTHNQWHRDLTVSMNFQLGLLQIIAEKTGWDPNNLPLKSDG